MKFHATRLGAFAMALGVVFGGARRADADLVYDNGSWHQGAIEVNAASLVTDSFTVATTTALSGAQVEVMAIPGDVLTGVSWSIGTSAFGSEISSGTASLTNTPTGLTYGGYWPVVESTFLLSGTVAAGTTYFLTLTNLSTAENGTGWWDQSEGPSSAFSTEVGGEIGSTSFQLYGVAAVPEPATITQLGIAAVCLIGYRLRRLKKSD